MKIHIFTKGESVFPTFHRVNRRSRAIWVTPSCNCLRFNRRERWRPRGGRRVVERRHFHFALNANETDRLVLASVGPGGVTRAESSSRSWRKERDGTTNRTNEKPSPRPRINTTERLSGRGRLRGGQSFDPSTDMWFGARENRGWLVTNRRSIQTMELKAGVSGRTVDARRNVVHYFLHYSPEIANFQDVKVLDRWSNPWSGPVRSFVSTEHDITVPDATQRRPRVCTCTRALVWENRVSAARGNTYFLLKRFTAPPILTASPRGD